MDGDSGGEIDWMAKGQCPSTGLLRSWNNSAYAFGQDSAVLSQ